MISVTEARQLIQQQLPPAAVTRLPLTAATGLVLADAIYSPVDIPHFHQAAMDGYAFLHSSWQQQPLPVTGVLPAGHTERITLPPGRAARIYTGAAVPAAADTVVMQEQSTVQDQLLYISNTTLPAGSNVRLQGSEIARHELALAAGTLLNPATIGFLAGMGIAEIPVFAPVRVSLIITGSELQPPGSILAYGQVYDANSFTLTAALKKLPVQQQPTQHVPDNAGAIAHAIRKALPVSDVVLLTGGVGVGDFDFVTTALQECAIPVVFHKIRQKPGKPLLLAKHRQQLIFGLPGNPASVLTCFYEYVLPALLQMAGQPCYQLPAMQCRLTAAVEKKPGLTHFMKAVCTHDTVSPLGAQESFRLSSFVQANCLLILEEAATRYEAGDTVTIHLLPDSIPHL